jgi:hypothetical protein
MLVTTQVTLGAFTVLSRREVWINSLHVVCGALVLTTSLVLTLRGWRVKFAGETVRLEPDTTTEVDGTLRLKPDTTTDHVRGVALQPDHRGRA